MLGAGIKCRVYVCLWLDARLAMLAWGHGTGVPAPHLQLACHACMTSIMQQHVGECLSWHTPVGNLHADASGRIEAGCEDVQHTA